MTNARVAGRIDHRARIPLKIRLLAPVLQRLLAAGIPIGPNGLITVRGRRTGIARTTGVAIIEIAGRRWVWCPWGDAQWVRNLRAGGRATITIRGRSQAVVARELDRSGRVAFHRDLYGPWVRSIPFGRTFIRLVDGVDVNDPPVEVAEGRPVFALEPAG